MATLAFDGDDVLPEVVSEANHGKRLAGWHHKPIVARSPAASPSSSRGARTLYETALPGGLARSSR
jgi:hypothetical protein